MNYGLQMVVSISKIITKTSLLAFPLSNRMFMFGIGITYLNIVSSYSLLSKRGWRPELGCRSLISVILTAVCYVNNNHNVVHTYSLGVILVKLVWGRLWHGWGLTRKEGIFCRCANEPKGTRRVLSSSVGLSWLLVLLLFIWSRWI